MLAEAAADVFTTRVRRDHESGVRDVRAESALVRLQDAGPDDLSFTLGDVASMRWIEPVRQCFLTRCLRVERVGIAGSDDRMKDLPDRVAISRGRFAYSQRHGRPDAASASRRTRRGPCDRSSGKRHRVAERAV